MITKIQLVDGELRRITYALPCRYSHSAENLAQHEGLGSHMIVENKVYILSLMHG
jgi:hypothetical protein